MKLVQIEKIEGKILLKSGLHIGSGSTEMHIGGTDNPVVIHPINKQPYIPGSSLKGKIRSLLEQASGAMSLTNGQPIGLSHLGKLKGAQAEECRRIVQLFGAGASADLPPDDIGPTRISISDCALFLDEDWIKKVAREAPALVEVKSENTINRITGTASNPRFFERVPAGFRFKFDISLKVFEGDSDLDVLLLEGMKMLEWDYLGGSGSRGYGRISFEFDDLARQKQFDTLKPFSKVKS